ncbi:MAG: hypothetical protein ACI8UO_006229 [Verrucomicrobiales bacterium]|jgi:hypothetical protein
MKRPLQFLLILACPAFAAADKDDENPHFERVRDLAKEEPAQPAQPAQPASSHFQTLPIRPTEIKTQPAAAEPVESGSAEIEALRDQLEILGGAANPARIGQIEERLAELERRLSRLEAKMERAGTGKKREGKAKD